MSHGSVLRRIAILGVILGLCQVGASASNTTHTTQSTTLLVMEKCLNERAQLIQEHWEYLLAVQAHHGDLHLTADRYGLVKAEYEERIRVLGVLIHGYNQLVDQYDCLLAERASGAPPTYEFYWRLRQPHFTKFVRMPVPEIPAWPERPELKLLSHCTRLRTSVFCKNVWYAELMTESITFGGGCFWVEPDLPQTKAHQLFDMRPARRATRCLEGTAAPRRLHRGAEA